VSRTAQRIELAVLAAMASGCFFPSRDPNVASNWVYIVDPAKVPAALGHVGAELEDVRACTEACGYYAERCERVEGYIVCERAVSDAQIDAASERAGEGYDLELPIDGHACMSACGGEQCTLRRRASDGRLDIRCRDHPCIGGRRPPGWEEGERAGGCGGLFAHMAALEAASVAAFEQLADELRAHGAPRDLVARAERAAGDERRHAAVMRSLARDRGVRPERRVRRDGQHHTARRSLLAIALDNASEGEGSELVGAAIARWQGLHASGDRTRRVFAAIARDETEHAELASDINAWILPRLSRAERAQVRRARTAAFERLRAPAREPAPELVREAGLPSEAERQAIVRALSS
jgi:rubrerythrin